jgi:hypothetical protein
VRVDVSPATAFGLSMCRRRLLLSHHSHQQSLFCQQLSHDHHLVILAQVELLVLAQAQVELLVLAQAQVELLVLY